MALLSNILKEIIDFNIAINGLMTSLCYIVLLFAQLCNNILNSCCVDIK